MSYAGADKKAAVTQVKPDKEGKGNGMEKINRKLPVLRDIKAIYQSLTANSEMIEKVANELSIHGQVIGEAQSVLADAQKELSIHGQAIGEAQSVLADAKKELSIHGQAIGEAQSVLADAQKELSVHGQAIGENRNQIEALVMEICSLKAKVNELERTAQGNVSGSPKEESRKHTNETQTSENSYYSIDYFDFENKFRGSREAIMERQRTYLPYFEGCEKVIDIGCGRGEFLALMHSQNIGAVGVDTYEPFVEYVKMQGLPCVCEDANDYLQNATKIDGIFLGQVVEHLSIAQIIELLRNAYEALEPGRYLIMETPNPMTLSVFSHAFYMDPSHEKPVHPYTLKYITERAGFSSVEILFTDCSRVPFEIPELKAEGENIDEFNKAMKQLSEDLYGSQDYAIIARK